VLGTPVVRRQNVVERDVVDLEVAQDALVFRLDAQQLVLVEFAAKLLGVFFLPPLHPLLLSVGCHFRRVGSHAYVGEAAEGLTNVVDGVVAFLAG